jgi:hypothetical protein
MNGEEPELLRSGTILLTLRLTSFSLIEFHLDLVINPRRHSIALRSLTYRLRPNWPFQHLFATKSLS